MREQGEKVVQNTTLLPIKGTFLLYSVTSLHNNPHHWVVLDSPIAHTPNRMYTQGGLDVPHLKEDKNTSHHAWCGYAVVCMETRQIMRYTEVKQKFQRCYITFQVCEHCHLV
ncbi:hypothetical protein, unlikely [Trypanosoma brucei gambiense DAL972]|uniref:Uncharacterized protein n=1 Tax=Trypanosoma brucei gambiense (strain MHOM/CI/86/DAL972) TaxID=679716 RepID=C9ZWK9_TRYB9|nr:hypothetical protein, unlikely [Trypanosoma brucei gambiense DAL972]CBH13798.1 hypothetical protein, unlikely [Trypanosoma brucei gambiense DAL972]|eukprot:XP_011776074.1 hypothetical protein, unlikely [Trypanosoma brucei gambiense DAL972]